MRIRILFRSKPQRSGNDIKHALDRIERCGNTLKKVCHPIRVINTPVEPESDVWVCCVIDPDLSLSSRSAVNVARCQRTRSDFFRGRRGM